MPGGVVATQPWQKRRLEVGGYGLNTGTQSSHVSPPALHHGPATDTSSCSSRHTVTMVTLRTWARWGLCEGTEEQGDFLAFLCGSHWSIPGPPTALGDSPNSPLLNSFKVPAEIPEGPLFALHIMILNQGLPKYLEHRLQNKLDEGPGSWSLCLLIHTNNHFCSFTH